MTNKMGKDSNPLKTLSQSRLVKRGVSFLGGVSLLGSSLLPMQQAQATGEVLVIPETSAPVTPPATQTPVSVPQANPVKSPAIQPVVPFKPKTIRIAPNPVSETTPTVNPKVQLSAPKITIPQGSSGQNSNLIIPQVQPSYNQAQTGKNSYIDNTQYTKTSPNYTGPSSVILTERSTGCQRVAQNGQLSGGCGGNFKNTLGNQSGTIQASQKLVAPRNLRVKTAKTRQNLIVASKTNTLKVVPPVQQVNYQPQPVRQNRGVSFQPQPISSNQVVSLQPIEMNGLKIALAPVPRYNRSTTMGTPQPTANRRTDLLFPIAIPAQISSPFGWRIHPIAGSGRMHEGTDIAAPLGTPVLAAYQGEVAVAGWTGGYGLMVALRHLDGTQESRYAHLSEIYVKPGDKVEQGTIIGRVGSTGFSTGPHLHFEWRHLTAQGWVAVDAGNHLEYALENLIESMPVAKNPTQNDG